MRYSLLQNCLIQAFKASHPPQLTTARHITSHVRITLFRSYMNSSELANKNYSNQRILIYSECRGVKTLSRRGGRGVRFWAFLPSTRLSSSTHIFCDMSQFVNAILKSIRRNQFLPSRRLYCSHIFSNTSQFVQCTICI